MQSPQGLENTPFNGSVRWHTFIYLDLFLWPMGKNSGNRDWVCRYIQARGGSNKRVDWNFSSTSISG